MTALLAALAGQAGSMVVGIIFGLAAIWLLSAISDVVLNAIASGLFDYASNWISIPAVGQVILWGQAISIVLVVVVRIAVGINKGILQDELRAPEYLFKSVGAVVLVAIMPIACNLVITAGHYMMRDVLNISMAAAHAPGVSSNLSDLAAIGTDASEMSLDELLQGFVPQLLFRAVIVAAAAMLCVSIYVELMVRQVQMLVVGCAAPWVGVKAATESDSGQYWDLIVGLLGMCLIQVLQTFFLYVSLAQLATLLQAGTLDFAGAIFNGDFTAWYKTVIVFALLIATKSIPALLSRWTFAGSGGRSTALIMTGGRMVAGAGRGRLSGGVGSAVGQGIASKVSPLGAPKVTK